MADEKKIGFKGDVSGFLSELSKANQQVKNYYNESLTAATKLSNSTSQQTEFLKLQSKEAEKRIALLKKEQETLIATFEIEKKRIQAQKTAGTLTVEQAKSQIKAGNQQLNQQLGAGDVRIKDLDKMLDLLRGVKDEIHAIAAREIIENKKRVIDQVKEFKQMELREPDKIFDKYTPEQIMKLNKQSEMLGGVAKPEQKKEQSIFGAILGAEIVKGLYNKTTQAAQTLAGGTSGDQVMADMVKGIGFVVGDLVGTLMSRHREEMYKADVGLNKFRGKAGRGSMFSDNKLGYSISETMPIAEQAVDALGTSKGYEGVTRDVMKAERAFSLDRGTLLDMLKSQRMTSDGDLSKNISIVYNTMKTNGYISDNDTAQFQEILQLQTNLMQKQGEVMDVLDPNMATGVIAAFKGVGGRYGDARAEASINTISSGLSNPGNDFQRAMNLKVLSKLKPGANLFEIEEMEEKGVMQEGFLDSFLKETEASTGGGEGMLHTIKARFPQLGAAGTRKLVESYQGNRNRFKDMSADGAMKEINMYGRAVSNTSDQEQSQSRITDKFVDNEWEGLKQVGVEFGLSAANALERIAPTVGGVIAESFKSYLDLDLKGNPKPKPKEPENYKE